MHRAPRWISSITGAILVSLATFAASAQAQPLLAANDPLTVDDVRTIYTTAGYQVGNPINWEWTSPPHTTVQVRDQSKGRIVMVFVYSNTLAASYARSRAEANEEVAPLVGSPHLVPGYGPSTWIGNVALVQTQQAELDYQFKLDNDRANGLTDDAAVSSAFAWPQVLVDTDFQEALQLDVVSL